MTKNEVIRSPLLHFFIIGIAIFLFYAMLNDTKAFRDSTEINITPKQRDMLVDRFTRTWNRPPTASEEEKIIYRHAIEEAYIREALALQLDQDDEIIRRRLVLKMQFLIESQSSALIANDEELKAYFENNPDKFIQPAEISFEQILIPENIENHGVKAIINNLNNGTPPHALGKASLLPSSLPLTTIDNIDKAFGNSFGPKLTRLPTNQWTGPITSNHGSHLVIVLDRTEASLPLFDDIKDRIETEWKREKLTQFREAFEKQLIARYNIQFLAEDVTPK